ncbi:MAG: NAD(P)/FAD-dependent oxidoreductase [Candidatus Limnocylindria bacterium]
MTRAERSIDVLAVGGGVASVRCVRTLRRNGFSGSILLVGDEPHLPYNRPPLSKQALATDVPTDLLLVETPTWYERRSIEVLTGIRATSIDRERHSVELEDGARISYGRLLLATGATPRVPSIPGIEHGMVLRTFDDAARLRTATRPGVSAVIVGGGFLGVETAAALAARGVEVTVVELGGALWGGSLGESLSAWASRALGDLGISIRLNAAVTDVRPGAVIIGHESLAADVVVLCVGVSPRDKLARASGILCDDGIVTDARHVTSDVAILAAGDVARIEGRRVEHWHAAREGGERAAFSLIGREPTTVRAPWIFSDFGDHHLDVVGAIVGDERTEVLEGAGSGPLAVAWVDRRDRVTQLAVTDRLADPEACRGLIESGAKSAEVAHAIRPAN